MIVAITGGTGFIGRKLVQRHLDRGDEVRVLSRREAGLAGLPEPVRLYRGELSAASDLGSFVDGVDVLYHCAAELKDETKMAAVHVEGTGALIAAAAGRIGRWVQLSSTGAYGSGRDGIITEASDLRPVNTYEKTKVRSDESVASAGKGGAFEHAVLRPSNVYGREMTNQSLLAMMTLVGKGHFFFVGKPGASANYIHVDNVVDALVLCATERRAEGNVYNLSDHRSMEELVAIIAGVFGNRTPQLRLPVRFTEVAAACIRKLWPGFPLSQSRIEFLTSRIVFPTTKIQTELGYRHGVSFEAGMRDLAEFRLRERR